MSSYPQSKNLNVTTDRHTVVWVVLVSVQYVCGQRNHLIILPNGSHVCLMNPFPFCVGELL